jgi:hypothetical protein
MPPGLVSPAQHALLRARVTALPFCNGSSKANQVGHRLRQHDRTGLTLASCFVVKHEYHECCAVARLSEHGYLGAAVLNAEGCFGHAAALVSVTHRAPRVLLPSSTKHETAHLQCIKWVTGHRLVRGGHKGTCGLSLDCAQKALQQRSIRCDVSLVRGFFDVLTALRYSRGGQRCHGSAHAR